MTEYQLVQPRAGWKEDLTGELLGLLLVEYLDG